MDKNKYWNFKISNEDNNTAELYIYSEISSDVLWGDETTASTFKADLDSLGAVKTLNVYINSPGGNVFEGITIANMLKRFNATVNVYVDGLAASIASIIAMAGDNIYMYKNSMIMVHNPMAGAMGYADDLRKMADNLDQVKVSLVQSYLNKATDNLNEETITNLMDNETWMTASEASKYFSLEILDEQKDIAACANTEILNKYKNVPKDLIQAKSEKTIEDKKKIKQEQPHDIDVCDELEQVGIFLALNK
jgi:ATP-dependent Clp protease protease subunit